MPDDDSPRRRRGRPPVTEAKPEVVAKAAALSRRYSAEHVARAFGVTRSTIFRWRHQADAAGLAVPA